MGILKGNSKDQPLHYGEIFNLWSFSAKKMATVSTYQLYLNHAGDDDLKRLIRNLIEQARQSAAECDEILIHNGIMPPPSLPDRPQVELADIPEGARFADPEISLTISEDIATGMVVCSQIIGTAIRIDVGALFSKYYAFHLASAAAALELNKEKGWLMPPPLQIHRPEH